DSEVVRTEFVSVDGDSHVTGFCVLRAPGTLGRHVYRAVLVAQEKDGILHEESSAELSFTTLAHAAHVNAWGMPSAIAAGEPFRFTVGIKCSAGCKLSGRPLSIVDHQGTQVGIAKLRDDVWPGTDALYFAEVEATAPHATGDHQWQVNTPECSEGLPHAA